jgi:hypothetical protein
LVRSPYHGYFILAPFAFFIGLQASLDWSVADSIAPKYPDVANPFCGGGSIVDIAQQPFGMLSADIRIVDPFTFSRPAGGENPCRFGKP